jgi:predicted DCC family thiol-disulfide oxidoreductase YuxK
MVYDGDCGFCRLWVHRWKFLTRERVDYRPYQEVAGLYPEVPLDRFQASVQLIEPDGTVSSGAQAVFKGLSIQPLFTWLPWAYRSVPGLAFFSEKAYGFVASHRGWFSKAGSCGLASADDRPTYRISRWFFVKALALAFLVAFLSLNSQVEGLLGNWGLLPASRFLEEVHRQLGASGILAFPTLCWFNSSDFFLHGLCGAGILASLALLLDIAPALCLFLLWLLYLSLVRVGQDFLSFQWDNLLLEAAFLSLLASPLTWKPGSTARSDPPAVTLFLFQWLLFRLIFCAGVVKLSSGDTAWRGLTALCYHYHTQPLPTPWAWSMDKVPLGFQRASCLFVFFTELLVPFALWGPRRFKPYAFGFWLALQVLIALTGNYCFFNWVSAGLGFFFLEDAAWPGLFRDFFNKKSAEGFFPNVKTWPRWIQMAFLAIVLILSSMQIGFSFKDRIHWPAPFVWLYDAAAPFGSVNGYGLFAVMTTERPEIILEGSDDGALWKAYGYRFKPGDPQQAPRWSAPHQPRLDWQLWFAALGNIQENPWFLSLEVALLRGNEKVLQLMGTNPFPSHPPRYLRAKLYEYRFSTEGEKSSTGAWWVREEKGLYGPAVSLRQSS